MSASWSAMAGSRSSTPTRRSVRRRAGLAALEGLVLEAAEHGQHQRLLARALDGGACGGRAHGQGERRVGGGAQAARAHAGVGGAFGIGGPFGGLRIGTVRGQPLLLELAPGLLVRAQLVHELRVTAPRRRPPAP
jgi:hypothetical protein